VNRVADANDLAGVTPTSQRFFMHRPIVPLKGL
jgi:hypothetical protein